MGREAFQQSDVATLLNYIMWLRFDNSASSGGIGPFSRPSVRGIDVSTNRSREWQVARLGHRNQTRTYDLAIVEPQCRQPVESQIEKMHPVTPAIPQAMCLARRIQRHLSRETDFLGEFPPGGRFRGFAAPNAATRKVPGEPVGRSDQ